VKKNWTKIALALGPVLMISSVTWEYARIVSTYTFLIQPWAMRGHETIHGQIIVVLGILLLVAGLLTSIERALKPRNSALIVGYVVIAATGFTATFGRDTSTFALGDASGIALSLFLAISLSLALRSSLGDTVKWFSRALLTFIPLFFGIFVLLGATIVGESITVPTWLVTFIVSSSLGALVITIKPMDMSANRMLILSSVSAWAVVTFSAGAIRESLIAIQLRTDQSDGIFDVAVQYKDTQIAGGWWLAGFGTFVFFVGSVGLWARRRDVVAAIARAKKQREAAEESAREIQEAAEAYAREQDQFASG